MPGKIEGLQLVNLKQLRVAPITKLLSSIHFIVFINIILGYIAIKTLKMDSREHLNVMIHIPIFSTVYGSV